MSLKSWFWGKVGTARWKAAYEHCSKAYDWGPLHLCSTTESERLMRRQQHNYIAMVRRERYHEVCCR